MTFILVGALFVPTVNRTFDTGEFPDFVGLLRNTGLVFVLAAALLAAAVTRRLHDRGRSGHWGLMPIPFIVISLFAMARLFAAFTNDPEVDVRLFLVVFVSNLLYLATLGLLVVLLAGASTPGPNRYGLAGDRDMPGS